MKALYTGCVLFVLCWIIFRRHNHLTLDVVNGYGWVCCDAPGRGRMVGWMDRNWSNVENSTSTHADERNAQCVRISAMLTRFVCCLLSFLLLVEIPWMVGNVANACCVQCLYVLFICFWHTITKRKTQNKRRPITTLATNTPWAGNDVGLWAICLISERFPLVT